MSEKKEIKNNVEQIIQETQRTGRVFTLSFSQKAFLEKFREISPLTLISAGLIDGINPCAFAVIVFFVSFLAVYGYKKQEIVCIGIFYILAVFSLSSFLVTAALAGKSLFCITMNIEGKSSMVTAPDTIIIAKKNDPTVIYGTRDEKNMGTNPIAMTITLRLIARARLSKISG